MGRILFLVLTVVAILFDDSNKENVCNFYRRQYMRKVNNRKNRARFQICLRSTIKALERQQ